MSLQWILCNSNEPTTTNSRIVGKLQLQQQRPSQHRLRHTSVFHINLANRGYFSRDFSLRATNIEADKVNYSLPLIFILISNFL